MKRIWNFLWPMFGLELFLVLPILIAIFLVQSHLKAQKSESSDSLVTSARMGFIHPLPAHKIVFHSETSGKQFWFDFEGDTLKSGGELHPDSAAALFIEHVINRYSHRIRSLEDSIRVLRQSER